MDKVYNILNEEEMKETIDMADCRKIRQVISTLTCAPLLTKKEFVDFMMWANKVCDRLEKESEIPDC